MFCFNILVGLQKYYKAVSRLSRFYSSYGLCKLERNFYWFFSEGFDAIEKEAIRECVLGGFLRMQNQQRASSRVFGRFGLEKEIELAHQIKEEVACKRILKKRIA